MKHPHCNRSHVAHLFWCRGFAPLFFIVAIALFVVATGSGVYFASKKGVPVVPPTSVVQEEVFTTTTTEVANIEATTTVKVPTPVAAPKTSASPVVTTPPVEKKPVIATVNCGASGTTVACLSQRLQTCSPAKGVVTDPSSGMQIERSIDGYVNGSCSYRSTIISAPGAYEMLEGLGFDCMIPKALLTTSVEEAGSIRSEDMLTYCTGALVDLMRAQESAAQ